MKTGWFVAMGAAAAGAVAGLASSGVLHKAAVATTCAGMKVADAVTAETQSIVDDANDVAAEARRQAQIDAAVESCLAEVTAEVDAEASEA